MQIKRLPLWSKNDPVPSRPERLYGPSAPPGGALLRSTNPVYTGLPMTIF
jgi:hypothetical protein